METEIKLVSVPFFCSKYIFSGLMLVLTMLFRLAFIVEADATVRQDTENLGF